MPQEILAVQCIIIDYYYYFYFFLHYYLHRGVVISSALPIAGLHQNESKRINCFGEERVINVYSFRHARGGHRVPAVYSNDEKHRQAPRCSGCVLCWGLMLDAFKKQCVRRTSVPAEDESAIIAVIAAQSCNTGALISDRSLD